jgi:hypothetical protein
MSRNDSPTETTAPSAAFVALLKNRDDRQLRFAADVSTRDGVRVARARATHWIIPRTDV